MPGPVKRALKAILPAKPLPADEQALIRLYLDGGRIPWSPGYGEYRLQYVTRLLADEGLLEAFRDGRALPEGHGRRLDERVVEYPWALCRHGRWGPRVLDAGSTLNYPALLDHPALKDRQVIVYNLAHDWVGARANVSYIVGDLREAVLRDETVDVVVCISTLEHIGLDNTLLYTHQRRFREKSPGDYRTVLREFHRILRRGGRLLVTVPFGVAATLRWLQQFDRRGVGEIIEAFGGDVADESYFKYEPTGWVRSSADACAGCEYFDVHAKVTWDPDVAAAARAVACLELVKPARR